MFIDTEFTDVVEGKIATHGTDKPRTASGRLQIVHHRGYISDLITKSEGN